MPGFEELAAYLRGVWLLARGKSEGFSWLDMSDRGFRRSWWAVVFCLPPMFLEWIGARAVYLEGMPANASVSHTFWSALLALDVLSWTAPYLALLAAMALSGHAGQFRPAIVVVNWLSVPVQWVMMVISIVQIAAPANDDIQASLALVLYIVSAFVHFMVLWQIMERKALPAAAFLVTLAVSSVVTQTYALDFLGVSLG
jgi:hypothetical protein